MRRLLRILALALMITSLVMSLFGLFSDDVGNPDTAMLVLLMGVSIFELSNRFNDRSDMVSGRMSGRLCFFW